MNKVHHISVLGAGAWGTALAALTTRLGFETCLYARSPSRVEEINQHHTNRAYLDDIVLPEKLHASSDMAACLANTDLVLCVVPAQQTEEILQQIKPLLSPTTPVILCAKGIERQSGRLMSQLTRDILPQTPIAALSGPSFAADVARGLPTAVTIASENLDLAEQIAHTLSGPSFRCYSSDDLIGVELGGALKNVLALAAGMSMGRGLGASAQAALITRSFAELRRIARHYNATSQTLSGLAVLGDLVLTCSSPQSRNYAYGLAMGRGQSVEGMKLAEGVFTAPIAAKICREKNIEAPVIEAVASILAGQITLDNAIENLITRPLKQED